MAKVKNEAAACANCPYFLEKKDFEFLVKDGLCLRYPPVAADNGADYAQYPIVAEYDRCGEHPGYFVEES